MRKSHPQKPSRKEMPPAIDWSSLEVPEDDFLSSRLEEIPVNQEEE